MADMIERMEKMEAYIKVLNEEKSDSKMQIKLLETRIEKSEKRIQELEQRQEKPSEEVKCGCKKSEFKKMEKRLSEVERIHQELQKKVQEKPSEKVMCGFKKEEFKRMKRRVSDLERKQQRLQEQSQDARDQFEKIDKLQLLLNSMILKKKEAGPRDSMAEEVDSLNIKHKDDEATAGATSRQLSHNIQSDARYPWLGGDLQSNQANILQRIPRIQEISQHFNPFKDQVRSSVVISGAITGQSVGARARGVPVPAFRPQAAMGVGRPTGYPAVARQGMAAQPGRFMPQSLQSVVVPGQDPLTATMLAAAPAQEQKQMLGERLFPLIQQMHPDLAGKITGMLLEIDNSEILPLLESPKSLKLKVDEAVAVLQDHQAKKQAAATKIIKKSS